MSCIKDFSLENLDNLCQLIHNYFINQHPQINLSVEECYNLTQGKYNEKIGNSIEVKEIIFQLAYECIYNGKHLGNKTIADGKINTSSWVSHVLFHA